MTDVAPWMTRLVDTLDGVVAGAKKPVALHEPWFGGNEGAYVKECVDTGWVSSVGKFVDRMERDLCAFTGAAHAVVVANGTAALQLAYQLAGVKHGDEILMPALTFVATANAASHAGGVPHFLESEEGSMGVDVDALDAHLKRVADVQVDGTYNRQTGRRMGCVVTMHVFGHMMQVERLAEVCARYRLPLVEDAAEALGSRRNGKHAGTTGLLSALSFNGNKVVTTGGGGAILTNDPVLGKRAKHLTTTARVPHPWDYFHDEVGYNYRMPNLNAAMGCAQLEALPGMLERKARLAAAYASALRGNPDASFVAPPPESQSNHWLNAIRLARPSMEERDALLGLLHQRGLMCRPIWKLMHRLPMYAACPRMELTVAERLEGTIINVPSSVMLAPAGPTA